MIIDSIGSNRKILYWTIGALNRRFSCIHLISLDLPTARKAVQIAIEHRLRGADATYVAVADAFGATLISWDQEMLRRCPAAVATMTPES